MKIAKIFDHENLELYSIASYQLATSLSTVWRKVLTAENIDEFDEFPTICQYFPYQNFTFSHLPLMNLWRSSLKLIILVRRLRRYLSSLPLHKDPYGSQFLVHS